MMWVFNETGISGIFYKRINIPGSKIIELGRIS